jgi:hypothetical protein
VRDVAGVRHVFAGPSSTAVVVVVAAATTGLLRLAGVS